MIYHQETGQRVVEHLSSDPNVGLRRSQVEERRGKFGENRLREARKKTMFQRFLDQFKDAMILILLAAAASSYVVACVE